MGYVPTIQPGDSASQQPSPSMITPQAKADWSLSKLLAAFGYAFSGIWYIVRTQRNAQIHCAVGVGVIILGMWFGLERWEWLVLILTISLVFATEGINTAIEATVDLTTTQHHPLARIAKDVAAGVVLLCAVAAVIVGCIIFIPYLWVYFEQLFIF